MVVDTCKCVTVISEPKLLHSGATLFICSLPLPASGRAPTQLLSIVAIKLDPERRRQGKSGATRVRRNMPEDAICLLREVFLTSFWRKWGLTCNVFFVVNLYKFTCKLDCNCRRTCAAGISSALRSPQGPALCYHCGQTRQPLDLCICIAMCLTMESLWATSCGVLVHMHGGVP